MSRQDDEREEEQRRQREQQLEQERQDRERLREITRQEEAVRVVQREVSRQIQRAGHTVSADNLRQIADRATHHFALNPHAIDRVLELQQERRRDAQKIARPELREVAADARRDHLQELQARAKQHQHQREHERERQRGGR